MYQDTLEGMENNSTAFTRVSIRDLFLRYNLLDFC